MYGLGGGICDSLVFATTPIGMAWCGFKPAGETATRVGSEIRDIVSGDPGQAQGVPPPICTGAFLNAAGAWECPDSETNWTLWVALAAVGMFAIVAMGGGAARRYGR